MPQQKMGSKLGQSSSPIANRVIQNSKENQTPVNPSTAHNPGTQLNKQPVKP